VLVNVPEILGALVAANRPLRPEAVGADQEYTVPASTLPSVPSTGLYENVSPLQIANVLLLILGLDRVTVKVNVAPGQDPEVGVIV
jgi:hypothetical protein